MILLILLCLALAAAGIRHLLIASRTPTDDLAALAAVVANGCGTWAARENGSCCTCGHEWGPGEIIGVVTQAFELRDDGSVWRAPATRIACAVCVERTRHEGDLSLTWAREAGLL
jgi:hypothetical protein